MFSLIRGCGIILTLVLWAQVAGAQISIEYPTNFTIVTFEDLHQNNGFRWTPVQGATEYEISVFKQTATGVPVNEKFIAKEPPFFVDGSYEDTFFKPGHFTWEVMVHAGEGIGAKSFQATFQLIDENLLLPTATPIGGVVNPVTPEIGYVRDVNFSPGNEITYGQSASLKINWNPPSYPEGASFSYDISVVWPNNISYLNFPNYNRTDISPFSTITTIPGQYSVLIRAKVGDKNGEIATFSFNVKGEQLILTPTPVARDPDVTKDQIIDIQDVATFITAFNTRKNQNLTYNPRLDFVQDEVIDKKDLLVFVQMYSNKNQRAAAPIWIYATAPVMVVSSTCPIDAFIDKPIVNNQYSVSNTRCNMVELMNTQFYFSEVADAVDYLVTINSNLPGFVAHLSLKQPYTGGADFVMIRSTQPGREIYLKVQALNKNGELGLTSETLTIVFPPQGG